MAAGARSERPCRAPAAGTAGRAGHNPSWAPAKPWAVAASPRSERSHLELPAIRAPIPSRMAATDRRERSRREPAAARRCPGATSGPPTCVKARVGLTAGWGSPGETAHIGPPPPRAESRRKPSPSKDSRRGDAAGRGARLRPALRTRGSASLCLRTATVGPMPETASRVYTRDEPSGGAEARTSRQLGKRRVAAGPCRKSRAVCTRGVGFPTSARPLGTLLPGTPSRAYTRDAPSDAGAAPAPLKQAKRPGGMSPMSGTACRVYTRDAISGSARQPAGGAGRAGGPREGPPRWPPRSTLARPLPL